MAPLRLRRPTAARPLAAPSLSPVGLRRARTRVAEAAAEAFAASFRSASRRWPRLSSEPPVLEARRDGAAFAAPAEPVGFLRDVPAAASARFLSPRELPARPPVAGLRFLRSFETGAPSSSSTTCALSLACLGAQKARQRGNEKNGGRQERYAHPSICEEWTRVLRVCSVSPHDGDTVAITTV